MALMVIFLWRSFTAEIDSLDSLPSHHKDMFGPQKSGVSDAILLLSAYGNTSCSEVYAVTGRQLGFYSSFAPL